MDDPNNRPLVFDLDGTFTPTDSLWEAFTILVTYPRKTAAVLRQGFQEIRKNGFSSVLRKSMVKTIVATHIDLSHRNLPVRKECLEMLHTALAQKRTCVLCTGSPEKWAVEFCETIDGKNPFDRILASTSDVNLVGSNKAEVLKSLFDEFDYVGNSRQDVPVWKLAKKSFLAGNCKKAKKAAFANQIDLELISVEPIKNPWVQWAKALRVHQWSKNFLIFVPAISAHAYLDPQTLMKSGVAFLAFCLAASGNYLLNDIVDAGNDRVHPKKKHRQIASGELEIPQALLASTGLIIGGMILAGCVNLPTAGILAGYLAISTFYSHKGKELPITDVTILAALYSIRIIAGGEATSIPISSWLLATSLFLFFSLALGKRHAELAHSDPKGKGYGRGYVRADRETVKSLGIASAMLAAGMLCLYTQGVEAKEIYGSSKWIWLLPMTCLFWTSRFWLLCGRNEIHEDPVFWAIKDTLSWTCAAIIALTLVLAKI